MKSHVDAKNTKREHIRGMFDSIAPKYDSLNHILSFQIDKLWRRRVVKIVKSQEPESILDLATGTADLAIAMAKSIPTAKIIGIDPSQGMLDVAHAKVKSLGMEEKISLLCGDAEDLSLADQSVDVVTVAFGVRNFENLERGIEQMSRVTKPNGAVVILEFSVPDNPLFRWIYNIYAKHILPAIGGLISRNRDAYEYLPASVERFATPAELVEIMQRAGLSQCEVRSQSFGIARIYIGYKR